MPSLPLDLKPSRVLLAGVAALAVLGALAVWQSAVPRVVLPVPLLLGAISAWRLHRLPRGRLLFHPAGQVEWWPLAPADGTGVEPSPVEEVRLDLRGPLAVISFRIQGRLRRWPLASDTLPGPQLRVLRLWLDRHGGSTQDPNSTPTH